MNLLFLDIETTGLDPEKHSIIEIAASLYLDYVGNRPIATFHRVLIPDTYEVTLGALAVNGRKFPLTSHPEVAYPHAAVLREFANWLLLLKEKYKTFVVCGQNVTFDLSFIETKLKDIGITELKALTGYRVLDIASVGFFLNLAGIVKTTKPSDEELAKEFGLGTVAHTATADIELSDQILYALLNLVKK